MPYWADVLVATPQRLENVVALHVDTVEGERIKLRVIPWL